MKKKCFCLLLSALLLYGLFAPAAYAHDTHDATLDVKQVFFNHTSTPNIDETFSYRLIPDDPSNPLPAGSDASGYTFAITGNSTVPLGPIYFSKVGVYSYQLKCVTPVRAGYTNDPEVYTITFYITNDQTPLVIVQLADGDKVPYVEVDPGYQAPTPKGKVEVAGTKTWDYGAAPSNDRPGSISVLIKNGNTTVKTITVTAAGGWKWSVLLPANDASGRPIHYSVDEANVPHYTHTVKDYNLKNTYVSPHYPGDMPKTGDSIPLLIGVLVASVAAGVLVLFLVGRRRTQPAQSKS